MRRFGNTPNPNIYYSHRPGAYGIFFKDNKILLTYEHSTNREWQLPGGGLEGTETLHCSLHRETFEETGWSVQPLFKHTIYKRYVFMPEYQKYAEKICHIYVGRAITRKGSAIEKNHEAHLVTIDFALKNLALDCDREILHRLNF